MGVWLTGKSIIIETKEKVNRSTAITFVILLFGALGAGFFFVIQNIFGVQHLLGALEPANEKILWFILFWATDFFFIGFTMVLCYLIAGLPAVAPSLALSIYFAHFAGSAVSAEQMYSSFFSTPASGGGGVNIGYLGYLVMALLLAYLIKFLYMGWEALKQTISPVLDRWICRMRSKIRAIPHTLRGRDLLDGIDLIVLVLILPVASAAITFCAVRYGIQLPFAAFAKAVFAPLQALASSNIVLAGAVVGLMVGFDLIGPVSMSAFGVAVAGILAGDARLMTIYGACFITIGWIPLFAVLAQKLLKKGPKADNDDFNLAVSGPINALFENVKLTVAFAMPYAYRSPFTVIPGLMAGSAATGFLTAVFGIVNTAYLSELPRYGGGQSFETLVAKGEYYLSFTLPLRSGDWLRCRIPLFFIILAGGLAGGLVIFALKRLAYRGQIKRGTYVETKGDIVVEMRELAQSFLKSYQRKETAGQPGKKK